MIVLPQMKQIVIGMGLFCTFLVASCTTQPSLNQVNSPVMPKGFMYLDEATKLPEIQLRYATDDNFVGRPLAGYRGKRAILRTEAASALKKVAEDFHKQGYTLVIYDAYRPHTAVMDISMWGNDPNDQKMKSVFYPNIDKKTVFGDKYLRNFSEHSRGVAVDVTLRNRKTGKLVNMGGFHDLLDPISATNYPGLTPEQRHNRHILKSTFEKHGFVNYKLEWWHYFLKDEPDINSYYLFPLHDEMKKAE